jgi:hypothetical protein
LEHSVIERAHQTIAQQAIAGQSFRSTVQLHHHLADRIDFLNQRYPSLAHGGHAPLQVYPEAHDTNRPYRLEWEEYLLDIQRVVDYLAQGRWFRWTSTRGQFYLGSHRYNAKSAFARRMLEITLDPHTHELVCLTEDGRHTIRFPCLGLTKDSLLGELNPLMSLPVYQLQLPFSQATWRQLMLCDSLTGTTLRDSTHVASLPPIG